MSAAIPGTAAVRTTHPDLTVGPEPAARAVPATHAPATPTEEERLRAVDTLLADPEAIPDPLEVELYAYREQLTREIVG